MNTKRQVSPKERAELRMTLFGGSLENRQREARYYEAKINTDYETVKAEHEGAALRWRERFASWFEKLAPLVPYWLQDLRSSTLQYRWQGLTVLAVDLVFAIWFARETLVGDVFPIVIAVGFALVALVAGHWIAGKSYMSEVPRRSAARMEDLAFKAAVALMVLLALFAFARTSATAGAAAFDLVCVILSAGVLPCFAGILLRISQAHAELNTLYALFSQADSELRELTMFQAQARQVFVHGEEGAQEVTRVPGMEADHAEA